jgi:hypothetical protein
LLIIIGYLRKGKLKNLEYLSIKLWYLLSVAFLIQLIAIKVNSLTDYVFYILHLSSYVIITYVCWINRHYVAIQIIGLGNSLNAFVIAFNEGKMPVKVPEFISNPVFDRGHALLTDSTQLSFLSDILLIRIPSVRLYMLSLGDIVLMIGVLLLIQKGMKLDAFQ